MCYRHSQLSENHVNLLEDNFALQQLGGYVHRELDNLEDLQGTEDLGESLKELGAGLFTVTKWIGGKSINALTAGFNKAGKSLYTAFADNESFIKHALSLVSKDQEHVFTVPKDKVSLLTHDGNIGSIQKDTDVLLEALSELNTHSKAVLNHLDQQLVLVRKLKSVKNNDEAIHIIEQFEELKYPVFKLPHSSKEGMESEVLPGGKYFRFTEGEKPSYSLVGETPVGEAGEVTLSKSDVSQWLGRIDKVNSLHKQTKAAYDDYLRLLKNWSDAVKEVDRALGEAGWVSSSTHKGVDKLLGGDSTALLFYSGFMPRVVGFADRYIHGVLRLFA